MNAISLLIGCLIYKILCNAYNYETVQIYKWRKFDIGELLTNISSYLMNLGYPANDYFGMNINALTVKGLLGAFGIITVFAFLISTIRLVQKYNKLDIINKSIFVFSLSSILITIFIFTSIFEETNGSYYIPVIPFAFIIIELEIENEEFSYEWLKNVFKILMVGIVFIASIPSLSWYIEKHPRRDKDIDRAVKYLEENNINCIYAEFWDANVVTELSNGKIEAYTVIDTKELEIFDLLQCKDHKDLDKNEIYILVNDEVKLDNEYSKNGIELIYSDDYSIIKATNKETYINYFKSLNE